MFSNLRNGSTLYILHKDTTPTIEISKVVSVSNPLPAYGQVYNSTLDVTTENSNYQKLPANSEIADFGNQLVITSSKEAMNQEITNMKQRSQEIINSIEQHQNIIKGCNEIYKQLNPEIVQKQESDEALRKEINELKDLVKQFIKNGSNN